jgi:hypothetical protein
MNILSGLIDFNGGEIYLDGEDFKRNKTLFEGSVEWHMEWVKLDLEARKVITRIDDTSQIKFRLA